MSVSLEIDSGEAARRISSRDPVTRRNPTLGPKSARLGLCATGERGDPPAVAGADQLDRVLARRLAGGAGAHLRAGGVLVDGDRADGQARIADVLEPLLERDLARQPDLLDRVDQLRGEDPVAQRLVVLGGGGALERRERRAD